MITWINLFIISLATGFGLGFGFWAAHLFCRNWYKKSRVSGEGG